jgi:hypothetical protein
VSESLYIYHSLDTIIFINILTFHSEFLPWIDSLYICCNSARAKSKNEVCINRTVRIYPCVQCTCFSDIRNGYLQVNSLIYEYSEYILYG